VVLSALVEYIVLLPLTSHLLISLKAERGVINKNQEVEILGLGTSLRTTVTGIGKCHYNLSSVDTQLFCRDVP